MRKLFADQAYMARTADGEAHGNRLVVSRLKTVAVHLDIPHRPADLDDRFRLIGAGGAYDRTLGRTNAVRLDDGRMLLLFTDVPPGPTYSLYQALTAEIEAAVFLDVPFADLPDYGIEGSAPRKKEPKKPVFGRPPRPLSDDPLVHADVADCRLDSRRYLNFIAQRTASPERDSVLA